MDGHAAGVFDVVSGRGLARREDGESARVEGLLG